MGKQKEQAAAPAEQEQKFENEAFDAALHELKCLEAGLDIDKASQQTKFFLHEIKKRLKQATNRTYQDAIHQVCSYFDDADFTYTSHLELLLDGIFELNTMRQMVENELGDKVCREDLQMPSLWDYLFKTHLLLWDLKPIAMDQERRLQRQGSARVGYKVVEE